MISIPSLKNCLSKNGTRSFVTARAVIFSSHGEPIDTIKVHSYKLDKPSADEILLQAVASPINPSDINQVEGVYPSQPEKNTALGTSEPSAVGGNEGLFKVIAAGSNVKSFQEGDWCIPLMPNFGTWRTHVLTNESAVYKIPNDLSLYQAATISVNPTTAYKMLTEYVKLNPGDWFIQNGGNSAVGKFAIQIGKKLGYKSISVVRDRENLSELIDELTKLGADHVITEDQNNSKDFGANIKEWTRKEQVKLALNCVGGKNATGIARKLSKDGIMVTYGGMSKQPITLPPSLHIFKNITSTGFWLTASTKKNPEAKKNALSKIVELYQSGDLKEIPFSKKPYDIATGSDEKLMEVFRAAITDSKKSKQVVTYN